MSFEKVDIESNVTRCESMIANARSGVVALGGYLNSTIHEISKAYAEIDRLTAENADLHRGNDALAEKLDAAEKENSDLREQLKVRERDIQLLSTANDDLRRKAMVAEAEPLNPQWTPPKSLKDGDYAWDEFNRYLIAANGVAWSHSASLTLVRDWTDPPVSGRWRITDGKAEYLGP